MDLSFVLYLWCEYFYRLPPSSQRYTIASPREIKVVSNHTCSLHTCVCAGSRRERVRLSGLINGRNQFNSWGFLQAPHSGPGLCRTVAFFSTWTSKFCVLEYRYLIVPVSMWYLWYLMWLLTGMNEQMIL